MGGGGELDRLHSFRGWEGPSLQPPLDQGGVTSIDSALPPMTEVKLLVSQALHDMRVTSGHAGKVVQMCNNALNCKGSKSR